MRITLSKRLQCIADKIEKGCRVADVGTDHGYIPAWLVQNGVCDAVIASDLREGPLQSARKTAVSAGVANKIDLRLCSGLDAYSCNEFDTAIIAGMGGETLINILGSHDWTRSKRYIIQPQSKIPELRSWLYKNGFVISTAELVYDTGRIYLVWTVQDGDMRDYAPMIVDEFLIINRDPLLGPYLEELIKRELKTLKGMEKAARPNEAELSRCRAAIDALNAVKQEVNKWQK